MTEQKNKKTRVHHRKIPLVHSRLKYKKTARALPPCPPISPWTQLQAASRTSYEVLHGPRTLRGGVGASCHFRFCPPFPNYTYQIGTLAKILSPSQQPKANSGMGFCGLSFLDFPEFFYSGLDLSRPGYTGMVRVHAQKSLGSGKVPIFIP